METDPFVAAGRIEQAAAARWGFRWESAGTPYVAWKLGRVPADLPVAYRGEPLEILIPEVHTKDIYAATVSWYGEESRINRVIVTIAEIAEPGEAGEEAVEEGDDEAAEGEDAGEEGDAGEGEGAAEGEDEGGGDDAWAF
jgi:hypothetical protein